MAVHQCFTFEVFTYITCFQSVTLSLFNNLSYSFTLITCSSPSIECKLYIFIDCSYTFSALANSSFTSRRNTDDFDCIFYCWFSFLWFYVRGFCRQKIADFVHQILNTNSGVQEMYIRIITVQFAVLDCKLPFYSYTNRHQLCNKMRLKSN